MPRKSTDRQDLQNRLAELSGLDAATRDDARVAEALHDEHETREMDWARPLDVRLTDKSGEAILSLGITM